MEDAAVGTPVARRAAPYRSRLQIKGTLAQRAIEKRVQETAPDSEERFEASEFVTFVYF